VQPSQVPIQISGQDELLVLSAHGCTLDALKCHEPSIVRERLWDDEKLTLS